MLAVGDKVLMGWIAADVQPPQTLTADPIRRVASRRAALDAAKRS